MVTFHFLGQVIPEIPPINLRGAPVMQCHAPTMGLEFTLAIDISNSQIDVTVTCRTHPFSPEMAGPILTEALDVVRGYVNMTSFALGYGLTAWLPRLITPDGTKGTCIHRVDQLADLCTAYRLDDGSLNTVRDIAFGDDQVLKAFNDLGWAITVPYYASLGGGRALDRIKHSIAAPGSTESQAWAQMHKALNVDAAYLRFVTDRSTKPRHGQKFSEPAPVEDEIHKRCWAVMNRFLEYLKRKKMPLPQIEFPLLKG
jgi:hypothetical protein